MSFQAYLDNVKAKTGETPEDFAALAAQRGLAKHGELVKWLKSDFALGHGHATAIAGVVLNGGAPRPGADQKLGALFTGAKQRWRQPCDGVIVDIKTFGADADIGVGGTYVSLLRAGKKFAILQPSSAERLDVGIKLKGAATDARFEAAGSWNAMVTHRVRIHDPAQIDGDLLSWLMRAYEAAG